MEHINSHLIKILPLIEFGSSIAEQDDLLEDARVETSAFGDLLNDNVDLVPGTKGSGKSALYRIFVEFLPDYLLEHRKAVIAHGVNRPGDSVFHAFNEHFEELDEEDFVSFWYIYIISLVHEQLIKNPRYASHLKNAGSEIDQFRKSCVLAGIPEIKSQKSLRDVLAWSLTALKQINPKLKFKPPENVGEFELTLFGDKVPQRPQGEGRNQLPRYIERLRDDVEAILKKTNLNIWFMIDKLDEIFPRRSDLERRALRALLRTMRMFNTKQMRVKVFLRDDMLGEIVSGGDGFTALSHVAARQADTLTWSADQILTMIVNRLFRGALVTYLKVDREQLKANRTYREKAFYEVFPRHVHRGEKQSTTLRWIYTHTADANGVVTPRDVIDLLTRAKQHQFEVVSSDPSGTSPSVIGAASIVYAFEELSKQKKTTYLSAEFPHLWKDIEKFEGGKSEYTEDALRDLLGKNWRETAKDLRSIGMLAERGGVFRIPYLYRKGLRITQGRVTS